MKCYTHPYSNSNYKNEVNAYDKVIAPVQFRIFRDFHSALHFKCWALPSVTYAPTVHKVGEN